MPRLVANREWGCNSNSKQLVNLWYISLNLNWSQISIGYKCPILLRIRVASGDNCLKHGWPICIAKCFDDFVGWFECWASKVKQIFPTAEVYSAEIHTLSCCRWVCGHKIQSIATVLCTYHWYFAREGERKRDVKVNLGRLVICKLWSILIYCYSACAMTVVCMNFFMRAARKKSRFIYCWHENNKGFC